MTWLVGWVRETVSEWRGDVGQLFDFALAARLSLPPSFTHIANSLFLSLSLSVGRYPRCGQRGAFTRSQSPRALSCSWFIVTWYATALPLIPHTHTQSHTHVPQPTDTHGIHMHTFLALLCSPRLGSYQREESLWLSSAWMCGFSCCTTHPPCVCVMRYR